MGFALAAFGGSVAALRAAQKGLRVAVNAMSASPATISTQGNGHAAQACNQLAHSKIQTG